MSFVFLRRPNAYWRFTSRKKCYQTFIPTLSFIAHYVDVNHDDVSYQPAIQIYECNPDHTLKDGWISAEAARPFPDPTGVIPYRWRCPIFPVTLYQDQIYAVYFVACPGTGQERYCCKIGYRTGDEYPPGKMFVKEDYLEPEWTEMVGCDVTIGAFGEIFVLPGPPYAPVAEWALSSIEYEEIPRGLKVTVKTNVPVHLAMYWTLDDPWKHPKTGERRGDLTVRDIQYCFVNWNELWQEEHYDSLTHTFICDPWIECQWRWFAFRGTINDEWSPSTSAIFCHHAPYRPTWGNFYPDPYPETYDCDGKAWRDERYQTWSEIRDGPGQFGTHTSATIYIELFADSTTDTYRRLARAFMSFDVHTIPEDAKLLSAKLYLWGSSKSPDLDFPNLGVCICDGDQQSPTEIVASDYQRATHALFSADIIYWANWKVDDWNEFQLNAAGLAEIAKRGVVSICMRDHYYDVLNNEPEWPGRKLNWIQCHTSDYKVDDHRPRLEVWWIREPEEEE